MGEGGFSDFIDIVMMWLLSQRNRAGVNPKHISRSRKTCHWMRAGFALRFRHSAASKTALAHFFVAILSAICSSFVHA